MNVIKYLQENGIDKLEEELGIVVKRYDDRIVLNYGIHTPKFNPIGDECRALILSLPDYNILSRAFDRFYNYAEDQHSKEFDFSKCELIEKIDGSLISIYHDTTQWQAASRKMAFAEGPTNLGNTFRSVIDRAFKGRSPQQIFGGFTKDCTYIFEMVSPETKVLKSYNAYDIYLLAIRKKITGEYFSEDVVDRFAKMQDLKRPKVYPYTTYEEVVKSFNEIDPFDEGYIAKIDDWRIKIKNPSFVAMFHLRGDGLTEKRIINLVYMNDYIEYLSVFPEDEEHFIPYIKAYNELISRIQVTWNELKHIEELKPFAAKAINYPYSYILFSIKRGSEKNIGELLNSIHYDSKKELINYYK